MSPVLSLPSEQPGIGHRPPGFEGGARCGGERQSCFRLIEEPAVKGNEVLCPYCGETLAPGVIGLLQEAYNTRHGYYPSWRRISL
jgi:hypothetical protein